MPIIFMRKNASKQKSNLNQANNFIPQQIKVKKDQRPVCVAIILQYKLNQV